MQALFTLLVFNTYQLVSMHSLMCRLMLRIFTQKPDFSHCLQSQLTRIFSNIQGTTYAVKIMHSYIQLTIELHSLINLQHNSTHNNNHHVFQLGFLRRITSLGHNLEDYKSGFLTYYSILFIIKTHKAY